MFDRAVQNELKDEMPEIDAMVGVGSFGEIVNVLNVMESDEPVYTFGNIDAPIDETGRILSTGPSWAYIKIAEGCDNFCAYCIIPKLRGRFRSRPQENILGRGAGTGPRRGKRTIVVAQDITRYGIDPLWGSAPFLLS